MHILAATTDEMTDDRRQTIEHSYATDRASLGVDPQILSASQHVEEWETVGEPECAKEKRPIDKWVMGSD